MGRAMIVIAALMVVGTTGCESKEDKCKKACDDTVGKEHGADSEALKSCHELCAEATK